MKFGRININIYSKWKAVLTILGISICVNLGLLKLEKQTNKQTICFMKAKQEFSYLSRTITSRVEVNILSFLAEQAKSFLGRITFIIIFELELSHVVEQLGQMAADLSSR